MGSSVSGTPAGLDRRFAAFVLDRLFVAALVAAAGAVAYAAFLREGRWALGLVLVAGTAVALEVALALLVGTHGVSVGKAALGLRVSSTDGGAIGVGPGVLRAAVVGGAAMGTLGFGAATLAWTAAADPTGRRRGWHDLLTGSIVVDVRPPRHAPLAVARAPLSRVRP
jgi:uncharacterized RDD family membrane protein YckC